MGIGIQTTQEREEKDFSSRLLEMGTRKILEQSVISSMIHQGCLYNCLENLKIRNCRTSMEKTGPFYIAFFNSLQEISEESEFLCHKNLDDIDYYKKSKFIFHQNMDNGLFWRYHK